MALSSRFITALQKSILTVYKSMLKTYLTTLHHELLTIKFICQEHFHGRERFLKLGYQRHFYENGIFLTICH